MAFTWTRNIGATSTGSTSTTQFQVLAHTFEAGANVTVRRFIFDWHLDLEDPDNLVIVWADCKFGLGVQITTASSGTPPAPVNGPLENPNFAWWWWECPDYEPFFQSTDPDLGSFYRGHGRIDSATNHLINNEVNTSIWLVGNLFDVDATFSTVLLSSGSQILYAPQGA